MDPRVTVIGIFNSGEFTTSVKSTKVTKPIFYFLGGSTDIAYANGERDYKNLPATTPKWKGNLPVRLHNSPHFHNEEKKLILALE
jgi:hypothetical protein